MTCYKKILTVILIVITSLVVGLILIIRLLLGVWFWQINDTRPLAPAEIQAQAGQFSRQYPTVIKGNWEPNPLAMERMLVLDEARIKDLGVNTVSVAVEYSIHQDGNYTLRDEQKILSNLVRAKEKGFAVWLAVSFVKLGFGHNYEKKGITQDYYLKISEEAASKWAAIAEKYQVEFFCPQQELDFMIKSKFKNDAEETAQTVEDWHRQILPKIKKVYQGKVLAKIATPEKIINLSGYDYVGTGLFNPFVRRQDMQKFAQQHYDLTEQIALKSDCDWLVLEAITFNLSGQSQARYYQASIDEYLKPRLKKPVGYIFSAWSMSLLGIKNKPAEKILQDFFTKI